LFRGKGRGGGEYLRSHPIKGATSGDLSELAGHDLCQTHVGDLGRAIPRKQDVG